MTLIERLENKGMTIRGRVGRVFKQNNVTINKGQQVKISSNINSTCPSLGSGKIFLIGGNEDTMRGKLLLSSTSLIEAWSDETVKNIRKWQRLEKKGKKKAGKSSKWVDFSTLQLAQWKHHQWPESSKFRLTTLCKIFAQEPERECS